MIKNWRECKNDDRAIIAKYSEKGSFLTTICSGNFMDPL